MKLQNIYLGDNIEIDSSSSLNNVKIGDNVKIAKNCSIYGGPDNILQIGTDSYIGMNSILNGFVRKLVIGKNVSIAQNVTIMVDSGPNASKPMQKIFPIAKGKVAIGDHCWIGAGVTIMPGIQLGKYCVVAAHSYVNNSFPDYSIIGGSPAKFIRQLAKNEILNMK